MREADDLIISLEDEPFLGDAERTDAGRGHARRRHIVARWLIDFRDLMLTLDKTLTAIRLGQTYS